MTMREMTVDSKSLGSSMIMAPFIFGASTFYWKNGEYGITGGTILVLSMVFWIPAFIGLFEFLKDKMPTYTSIGFLIATYGCISGVCFGMVGVFSEAFEISHDAYLGEVANQPLAFNLLLMWSGPLFPMSLLVLGVNLFRKKVVPSWSAVMICIGALAFPLSRIPRIEVVAHIADLLLAIPLSYIGSQYLLKKPSPSHVE
jgi:hypothetical protein